MLMLASLGLLTARTWDGWAVVVFWVVEATFAEGRLVLVGVSLLSVLVLSWCCVGGKVEKISFFESSRDQSRTGSHSVVVATEFKDLVIWTI